MEVIILDVPEFPCYRCQSYAAIQPNSELTIALAKILVKLAPSKKINYLYLCTDCYDKASTSEIEYLIEIQNKVN